MKVIDYIRQKGILITNEQRLKIQIIWYVLYLFFGLSMISLMTIMALNIWGIIAFNRTEYWCVLIGFIIVAILTITTALIYHKNFVHKVLIYRLCQKHTEKFEVEMRDTTAENFEKELNSIYTAWARQPFYKFIKNIKLYEWAWGTFENNL